MNLLLVPVNLAGMFNSLREALTSKKVSFGRTPKVEGRVVAPAIYIAAEYGLVVALAVVAAFALVEGHAVHGAFALGTALILAYAVVAFFVRREGWHDLRARSLAGTDREPTTHPRP